MDLTDEPRDELLISRVLDGTASTADWAELELCAARDTSVWLRLAAGLRAERALVRAGTELLAGSPSAGTMGETRSSPARPRGWSALGWAAAVMIACLWGVSAGIAELGPNPGTGTSSGSGPAPTGTIAGAVDPGAGGETLRLAADEALERYRIAGQREGRFVEELPRVVMETRYDPGTGTLEVFYVRPLLERTQVDRLYELGQDETGALRPVPVSLSELGAGGSL